MALACVVELAPGEAEQAVANDWRVFIWTGYFFEDAPASHSNNLTEYSTLGWQKRRK